MAKKVLIACEESQAECNAFRNKGFEAYSCDLKPCSGGHPEWHIQGDALAVINGNCEFTTEDGKKHSINGTWDLLIAHPVCQYLTTSRNRYYNIEKYGDKAREDLKKREEAVDFFMAFTKADCPHIAIENPVGIMSTRYRKPDQKVQPWNFGDSASKATCYWTKDLPQLMFSNFKEPYIKRKWWYDPKKNILKNQDVNSKNAVSMNSYDRQEFRSKSFQGISNAMAEQWGAYINGNYDEVIQPYVKLKQKYEDDVKLNGKYVTPQNKLRAELNKRTDIDGYEKAKLLNDLEAQLEAEENKKNKQVEETIKFKEFCKRLDESKNILTKIE